MRLKKELTKEFLDNVAGVIDNEGFGYMMLQGGLEPCHPEVMLDSEEDIKKVNEALKIVSEYFELMPSL